MNYPNLSNVYPELETLLKNRGGNNNPWNAKEKPGVSGLSTWIRLLSSATVKGSASVGCILESINPSANDFTSVYGSMGGDYIGPGIIGRDFNGVKIQVPSGTSRALRPSPIITSMNIVEYAAGAQRTTTIKIRAFTQEQCDILASYFLEPGFHCLVEWGWNTALSHAQKVGGGGKVTPCDLVAYDQWTTIKEKRQKSDFTYDATLGIVAGGGVSFGDNESYEIEVKLMGVGNVAAYTQTHRDANNTSTPVKASSDTFKPKEISDAIDKNNIGYALFAQMYNQLPGQKRTPDIKKLIDNPKWADSANFVNMDAVVAQVLKDSLTESAELKTKSGKDLEIPKELPMLSTEKFIRFELACEIINTYPLDLKRKGSACKGYDTRSKIINIQNTFISGFPHMFSTDPTKLFIPNPTTPNFKFLEALSAKTEITTFFEYTDLDNIKNFSNIHPLAELTAYPWLQHLDLRKDPGTGKDRPVPYAFPNTRPLYVKPPSDSSCIPLEEKARFWGYLKDLYINFNFFVECISKPNFVIRDVFYEMLNGMSGACNSIWKFQICEPPSKVDKNGKYELAVVDLNFLGDISNNKGIVTFQARGVKSPFISCDFSIEVPGAMMSSIVTNKLKDDKGKTYDHGPELNPRPMMGSVFSTAREDIVGTILAGIQQAESGSTKSVSDISNKPKPTPSQEEKEEEAKIANFEFFIKTGAIYPKVQNREDKLDITKGWFDWYSANDNTLENVLMVGAWNDTSALRQCFLVDKGLTKINGKPLDTHNNLKATNKQNPPFGVANFDFKLHGVSGFKMGDQFQVVGIPAKFGAPNFYQIVGIEHTIEGMTWTTDIKSKLRIVGGSTELAEPEEPNK
jgi:hypothetical protein